jgi:hypothetical protein
MEGIEKNAGCPDGNVTFVLNNSKKVLFPEKNRINS